MESELTDKGRLARTAAEIGELDTLIARQKQLKDELIPAQRAKMEAIEAGPGADTLAGYAARVGQQEIMDALLGEEEATKKRIAQLEEKVPERLEIQKKLQLELKRIQGETMSDKER